MSKHITYTCNHCSKTYTKELKNGPLFVKIDTNGVSYKVWDFFTYQQHMCSECIDKLAKELTITLKAFFKVPNDNS